MLNKRFNQSGGSFVLVNQLNDKIKIIVPNGAVGDYLTEQGISQVEITAELIEVLVDDGKGNSHYELTFTFGPNGVHFNPPIQLDIQGKYASNATEVELYDENGGVISGTWSHSGDKITFEIPHLSNYYYDDSDFEAPPRPIVPVGTDIDRQSPRETRDVLFAEFDAPPMEKTGRASIGSEPGSGSSDDNLDE